MHTKIKLLCLFATLLPAISLAAESKTLQAYTAYSSAASGVIGGIKLSSDKIIILDKPYPLTLVRELTGQELHEAGKFADNSKALASRLYKTNIPPAATKENGSTICDKNTSVKWMLTVDILDPFNNEPELYLVFLSGENEPLINTAALNKTPAINCGALRYGK